MPSIRLMAVLMVVLFLWSGASEAGDPLEGRSVTRPLTWACLEQTSRTMDVPLAMILAVLDTEGGRVGEVSHNLNGSYDIGPMQINSLWLPRLGDLGVSERSLRQDGCVNVAVGAWLLKNHLKGQTVEEALARYHSRNPARGRQYVAAVKKRARRLRVERTIRRANDGHE